jgi:peptidyl-prolyl cis-trans isomerase D
MISWMQKHNKYLVWTIWVATIAFIGAGFVGWGSYDFGSKAGNVAKVGTIEIPQTKLNMVYSNIYGQYNQMMQGKLDDKKAKEMGLVQQAFATLNTQAKILNFAKDAGIIVSDKEVADKLEEIKAFQKDGMFNKEIYTAYLKNQRLKAKVFEATLREEMVINKTLALLDIESLPFEEETISAAMSAADKLMYKVLTPSDVNFTVNDTELKSYWETQKENFMTKKEYTLSVVWTSSNDTTITDDELKTFYETNSFNYTDANGKQLTFDEAKEKTTRDLKLKKTKKSAQKNYIAFKKGKLESSEILTLSLNDPKLTKEIWSEIQQKTTGDILKPKVVTDQYITIKIDKIKEPETMTFEEAKKDVTEMYTVQAKKEALLTLAESTLKNLDKTDATVSEFISLEKHDNLKPLNSEESLQFLQKLFTSSKEKGIISVLDKVIVYNIIEQKFLPMDENKTSLVKGTVNQIKKRTFESNLIKMLDKKYPTEVYMEGLTN